MESSLQNMQWNSQSLKCLSLVSLTIQNAAFALSVRHASTRPGDLFLSSSAVVMTEVVKLLTCLSIVFYIEGSFKSFRNSLYTSVLREPLQTIYVCVPSFLYIIQNNLVYYSALHLDPATYQVAYQLKIVTTAAFSVLILRKKIHSVQWIALFLLMTGIMFVQRSQAEEYLQPIERMNQNRLLGFLAIIGASLLSGLAGNYFEKILKGSSSQMSVWMRNVQLSVLSLPFGIIVCLSKDWSKVKEYGFLFGHDFFSVYVILLQAFGGILVAVVVKYADNILKGFATSFAIVISCMFSIWFYDFHMTSQFLMGSILVICSIFLYNMGPKLCFLFSLRIESDLMLDRKKKDIWFFF